MYEIGLALKYLVPKKNQLSVSIISLISIGVIALVVWLILVFFSVTDGLERIWTDKLVAVTAPLRVTPTSDYYQSYYFQIDKWSEESNFSTKTFREKLIAANTDPYDASFDEPLPTTFPAPYKNESGEVVDLVKSLYNTTNKLQKNQNLRLSPFETALATIRLNVKEKDHTLQLSQTAYLTTYDQENALFKETLYPLSLEDRKKLDLQESSIDYGQLMHRLISQGVEPIFLPKSFREAGVQVGDSGLLSYEQVTTSSVSEQRVPVKVIAFYDPGIVPIGGRLIFARPELVGAAAANYNYEESPFASGLNLFVDKIASVDQVKTSLQNSLQSEGLDRFWKVETFKEFFFTKDLLEQLQSERLLFSLISILIIAVACSNIVSMLIILVNDKKKEMGILMTMGARPTSIAFIFGMCGFLMGIFGSVIGFIFAWFTLKYLHSLISMISYLQGHSLFNQRFFGDTLPTSLSKEALLFTTLTTLVAAIISGVIPALKACRFKPAEILRSE